MISKEVEAQILRLFHVEKWRPGTIARELHLHHSAVTRVLNRTGAREVPKRASRLDAFVPFIKDTLDRHPTIAASRLFRMVRERGYPGGADHFRHALQQLRPRARPEAFLRLRTLPGEQAQVDWADFGRVRVGQARRQLMAFVMVLSFSRRIFLHFFPGQSTVHFLRGHVMAFRAFGGAPRVVLYDNLKSAVLERRGDAIHFNPQILSIAAHYRFEPRPVAPFRGNEKGRVERAISYVRRGFFEGLVWNTIEELNEKAGAFCECDALERPWPDDKGRKVRDAVLEEQPQLLSLPPAPFPAFDRVEVQVGKTPYVRFDLNDYSVPHELVGKTLVVFATMETVRILDGAQVVAQHRRSFDRHRVIEEPRHIEALVELKRRARRGRGIDRLQRTAPIAEALLRRMAERGANIGSATFALLRILDVYGKGELVAGVHEALRHGACHPDAVLHAIERRREAHQKGAALPIPLPDDPRVKDLTVTPHELCSYDLKEDDR
jgi:transposase